MATIVNLEDGPCTTQTQVTRQLTFLYIKESHGENNQLLTSMMSMLLSQSRNPTQYDRTIRQANRAMTYFDQFKVQPYPDNDGNYHDIEFLPCPFCLSKPYVLPRGNSHTKKRSVTVKCKECRIERTDATLRQDFAWLYKTAAKNWNQRPAC